MQITVQLPLTTTVNDLDQLGGTDDIRRLLSAFVQDSLWARPTPGARLDLGPGHASGVGARSLLLVQDCDADYSHGVPVGMIIYDRLAEEIVRRFNTTPAVDDHTLTVRMDQRSLVRVREILGDADVSPQQLLTAVIAATMSPLSSPVPEGYELVALPSATMAVVAAKALEVDCDVPTVIVGALAAAGIETPTDSA